MSLSEAKEFSLPVLLFFFSRIIRRNQLLEYLNNIMLMVLDPPTFKGSPGMKSQIDLTPFDVGVPCAMMAQLPLSQRFSLALAC